MECGSYRGIKLLEHAMKVVERIFEHRIRQQIVIDDMQFGFMKGKGTTDADDLAVIAETEEELIKRLNEWKDNVESKGMRVTHTHPFNGPFSGTTQVSQYQKG